MEDEKLTDDVFRHLEHCLKLLQCSLKEFKTNGWAGNKGAVEGYVVVLTTQTDGLLKPWQRRCLCATASQRCYLISLSNVSCLGVIDPNVENKGKCRAVNGVPCTWDSLGKAGCTKPSKRL